MQTRHLIDGIVRQTTVLIAQLSTAGGIRSPLSHVADQVFVSLAREIESQGVGRKVAADMFGLALRTYQKKVQRLAESGSEREQTLWAAVLDFVAQRETVTREQVLERFENDTERELVGVLTDLIANGLIHASGRGTAAVYGMTSDAERRLFASTAEREALDMLAWATIRAGATTTRALSEALLLDLDVTRSVVRRLAESGRVLKSVETDEAPIETTPLVIPLGTELGWEAAVLDHFRAVANAIAAKLKTGAIRADERDAVGGTTLSFKIGREHPYRARVLGLLARTREEAIGLWDEVETYNASHAIADEESSRVWFYFGQYVEES